MTELKKSLQKLLKWQHHAQKDQQPRPDKVKSLPKKHYSQYISQHIPKYQKKKVNSPSLEKFRDVQLENIRLFKKLASIQNRKNFNQQIEAEDKLYNQLYALNMASRRVHRKMKEKDLQKKNNQMIERIVKIRTQRSSLATQESYTLPNNRRRGGSSLLLPPISQNSTLPF